MSATTPNKNDRLIPWMLVGLMVSLVVAPIIMVVVAIKTFPGTATDHAYQKGLDYNKTIAAAAEQKSLGWAVTAQLTPTAQQRVAISVSAVGADGKALSHAKVSAQLVRPTLAGYDQTVELLEQKSGVYQAEATMPLRGNWEARISILQGDKASQIIKRFLMP